MEQERRKKRVAAPLGEMDELLDLLAHPKYVSFSFSLIINHRLVCVLGLSFSCTSCPFLYSRVVSSVDLRACLLIVHVRKKIITTVSPGFNFHKMIRYY
jgi:hypothetical protein